MQLQFLDYYITINLLLSWWLTGLYLLYFTCLWTDRNQCAMRVLSVILFVILCVIHPA